MEKLIKKTIGFLLLTMVASLMLFPTISEKMVEPDWQIFLGIWLVISFMVGMTIIGLKLYLED